MIHFISTMVANDFSNSSYGTTLQRKLLFMLFIVFEFNLQHHYAFHIL